MSAFMSPAGGGGSALQEAIARRGALQQQGPSSPTAAPLPVAPPPGNPQMVPNAPQAPQSNERVDDAHIILKAMAGRLKSQEKIAEAQAIPPTA